MTADLSVAMSEPAKTELGWRNWANLIVFVANFVTTGASLFGFLGPDNTELSEKYQVLITPSGGTFSIWGPIFLGEAIFIAAQMMPTYRNSKVVEAVTPGVVVAFTCQSIWNFVFAQELIPLSLIFMYGILFGLFLVAARADGLSTTWVEHGLIRAPLSLHLGWIIAASAVNTNVLFDYWRSSPEQLLGVAVASIGVVCILAAICAFVMKSPDPIVCFVGAWAFSGIAVELADGTLLNSANRHNPYTWDSVTLGGLELAATYITALSCVLAAIAIARVAWGEWQRSDSSQKSDAGMQELGKEQELMA